MCFTFKKNNKRTKNPVNCFLHDDESAGMRSPQTSIVIKLCQKPWNGLQGNSVIAVDGGEKVVLETLNFTRKPPGRHSLKLKQFCKVHVVRHNLLYL